MCVEPDIAMSWQRAATAVAGRAQIEGWQATSLRNEGGRPPLTETNRRRARLIRRLRRLSAIAGIVCLAVAIFMLLSTSVAFDGHVETIGGQRNTNSMLPSMGLLALGIILLALGLP
jgi:hypothetical protein